MPAAPAAAAAAAGLQLDVADLSRRAGIVAARGDFLIVEGAGGLLAPYAGASTNAELATRFALPILVVGRAALGTINHIALTLAELDRRGLPVAGVVLVRTSEPVGVHEASNADLIEALTGRRPLGTIPFLLPAEMNDADRVADGVAGGLGPGTVSRLLGAGG
jgi:dethiobiotin synthetase